MTTNKSHAECFHPSTKSARAKCRAERAQDALAALLAEAQRRWDSEYPKFAEGHVNAAHENADDTAAEEGFEPYSQRWYETALFTLHSARDNSTRCEDLRDPRSGDYLYREGRYQWVDTLRWEAGWPVEMTLVDDLGARSTHKIADLVAEREAEEA